MDALSGKNCIPSIPDGGSSFLPQTIKNYLLHFISPFQQFSLYYTSAGTYQHRFIAPSTDDTQNHRAYP
jgi:hypothetical protein